MSLLGFWDNDDFNQSNQPVVGVSWHDAAAYAKWAGKRLPKAQEWKWATLAGSEEDKYPFGERQPSSELANFGRNVGKTTPVGSYPENDFGLCDMAGNVYERCDDWFDNSRNSKTLLFNQKPMSNNLKLLPLGAEGAPGSVVKKMNRHQKHKIGMIKTMVVKTNEKC